MTEQYVLDRGELPRLLAEVEGEVAEVLGNGAYDVQDCYRAIHARGARAVSPPTPGGGVCGGPACRARDAAVLRGREVGRALWKEEYGYHRRSLAETAMMRLKAIFFDRLRSREWKRQETELRMRCAALNRMTRLGMPQSYPV